MSRSSFLRVILSLNILALGTNGDQNYTVTIDSRPMAPPYHFGSTLTLNCTVTPEPTGAVMYAWQCSGCFANGSTNQMITRDFLEIDDNSIINCTATIDGEICSSVMPFVLQVTVPTPSVAIIPSSSRMVTQMVNQTVNQMVSLECVVTAVRGITSRVEIVWSNDSTVLQRMNVTGNMLDNSDVVYADIYRTPRVSTTDDNKVIQCQVVINTTPPVIASGNTTLNVIVPRPMITVSPDVSIQGAMVGSPRIINCTVNTTDGVESSSVMISWMGPGGAIITTNDSDRVTVRSVTDDGNNVYSSSLRFDYLMEGDEGNYTCNVMILDTSVSQSVELQSLTVPIPLVSISPAVSIQGAMVGNSQAINCTVNTVNGVQSSSVMISWMGPGGAIITTNDRVTVGSVTDDGNNMYSSSLRFDYLMEGDEGNYVCNVMISGTSESQSVELQQPLSIPIPNVNITAPNNQTVGQSLTLQCEVTAVRGITSTVDIVWRSDDGELERTNNLSVTTMDNSLVYTNNYTFSQLTTTDDDRMIQCEVVINTTPPVIDSEIITLNVIEL